MGSALVLGYLSRLVILTQSPLALVALEVQTEISSQGVPLVMIQYFPQSHPLAAAVADHTVVPLMLLIAEALVGLEVEGLFTIRDHLLLVDQETLQVLPLHRAIAAATGLILRRGGIILAVEVEQPAQEALG